MSRPSWLLDVGLAINLAAAVSLLVAALYAKDALKVATFPTLLLIATLFRLAMNVSSTRLALSEGHAGEVIQAFGEFVVRGDYVVGAVIFSILTLVQFLVVTKGAERVAEVSARFTLDAMPGKQMSIDADLRAGAITQDQARARRRALERESQLFGSMDGVMKFVNYALIAIGDGLVSQIPSLAIPVAAGIVVTRVASEKEEDSLGTDIGAQFFGQHKALFVVAGLCLAFAAMPGMPHFTFILIAAIAVLVGLGLRRMRARPEEKSTKKPDDRVAPAAQPSKLEEQVHAVAPLLLDLAADLTSLVDEDDQAFVHVDLNAVRERLFFEMGVRVPAFRVRTGAPLPARAYALAVDEVPAGRGQLPEGALFVLGNAADLKAGGVDALPAQDALGRALAAVGEDRETLHRKGLQTRTRRDLLVDLSLPKTPNATRRSTERRE